MCGSHSFSAASDFYFHIPKEFSNVNKFRVSRQTTRTSQHLLDILQVAIVKYRSVSSRCWTSSRYIDAVHQHALRHKFSIIMLPCRMCMQHKGKSQNRISFSSVTQIEHYVSLYCFLDVNECLQKSFHGPVLFKRFLAICLVNAVPPAFDS